MAFENFPYANFHELNLDWILERVKEAYSASNPPDYPVKSVNGMTGDVIIAIPSALVRTVNGESGDVILYRNPLIQFPTTDESRWNLFRICDGNSGDARGIEFDEDGAHRIEGVRRILIYDEENQPDFPVTSVNGQTGDVRITAGVNSVNGKTGNVVTPFVNPNSDILKLDSNSNTVLWGISRDVAGGNVALYISRGSGTPQAFIRYTPETGDAINLPLLTSADIPAEAGVVSVNTKTGAVTLYGTDIKINDTSAISISEQLLINAQNMESILALIAKRVVLDPSLWESGGLGAASGLPYVSDLRIRMIDYVPDDCTRITQNINKMVFQLLSWTSANVYVGIYQTTDEFMQSGDNIKTFESIDLSEFKTRYPEYKYKIVAINQDNTPISTSDATNVIFEYSKLTSIEKKQEIINNNITALQAKDNTQDQQISALQTADSTHDSQIAALQAKDDTQDQQISALQTTDSSLAQQISALQTADSTHDSQIAALQAKDNTQDQQIAELYTKTGVYVVSISNANTLPLRYPASGTDSKIKDTNKVVSMDLSIPGAQGSNWTITTYNGYLEITGTMIGSSDITLYLA